MASGLDGLGMGGAWGQLIGVMNREPAPPPPRNQQAATARMPPSAKSRAKRTYSWAKPWVPCRRRTDGNGPAPAGWATAIRSSPSSGDATLNHCTASPSVPAGALASEIIGMLLGILRIGWATTSEKGKV